MSGSPPVKPDATGDRDPVTGRFLPGNSGAGGGRPRGLDFRRIVQDAHGETIDAKLRDVFDALLVAAKAGDVQAAKLLLDRLCDSEPTTVNLNHNGTAPVAPAVIGIVADLERAGEIAREALDELGKEPR